MPTYDYGCTSCENIFEVVHSFRDKPEIKCTKCGNVCKKQISSCSFSIRSGDSISSMSTVEMKQDLSENYGIESVNPISGTFKDFYQGVKKDGAKVKEQMKQGEENNQKKAALKTKEFNAKSHNRISEITEKRDKANYQKRAIKI